MKKILIIVGGIVVAALVAAGGFWGGMTYQKNQVSQAEASFLAARGARPDRFPNGEMPSGGQIPAGGQGLFRGSGTAGQVKGLEGNTLTLSTAEDVATVTLSDSTVIQRSVTGEMADLQPGVSVMVIGQADEDGTVAAERITILDSDPRFMPGAVSPTTEP